MYAVGALLFPSFSYSIKVGRGRPVFFDLFFYMKKVEGRTHTGTPVQLATEIRYEHILNTSEKIASCSRKRRKNIKLNE